MNATKKVVKKAAAKKPAKKTAAKPAKKAAAKPAKKAADVDGLTGLTGLQTLVEPGLEPAHNVSFDDIPFEINDETRFIPSVDFSAVGLSVEEFEEQARKRIDSAGEHERFCSNMDGLASLVETGVFVIEWITCEDESSRIDLHIRRDGVLCRVHNDAVELDESDA